MKITIFDQNEITGMILMQYLNDIGHNLSMAKTEEGAKKIFENIEPDLVLIDPMFSLNVVMFIPKHSKICIMSTNKNIMKLCKADYILDKPFTLDELDLILMDVKNSIRK